MIVRCGRCRVELEVPGPGEFVCPACGTRNSVRGGAPAAGSYDLGDLTVPGGRPPGTPPPPPEQDNEAIKWGTCPACSWRFAMGEVEQVTCPNCRAALSATPEGLRLAQG